MNQHRQTSSLLINESPLQVLPSLAARIGLNEAIILQQIHYWISRPGAQERDGRRWVYNSTVEWQDQFIWWSVDTIGRALLKLERAGLLISGCYNEAKFDRTKWYTIDYDALEALTGDPLPPRPSAKMRDALPQLAATTTADSGNVDRNLRQPIPETNTETNNRERETPARPLQATALPPDNMSPSPSRRTRTVVTLYQPEATGDISLISPVACESPGEPEVTIPVPRGTPVNRRPDAPPRQPRPQPKPETTAARLKTWEPDPDTLTAYQDECRARHIDPACIDVRAETVKWRLRKETAGLLPGQWSADWQFWLIRAMERYQAKQREGPPTVSGRPYKVL